MHAPPQKISYLAFQNTLHVACNVIDFHLQLTFLFLQFLLDSLNVVYMITEFSDTVGLFLAQTCSDGFVLQGGLLQITAQPLKLGLALLVQLGLKGSGSAGLIQPLADLFQLPGQVTPLFLHLGTSRALSLDFLF